MSFETPQDAEDAFYDALEAGDPGAMAEVWEKSAEVACLLPMTPFAHGAEVSELWRAMLSTGSGFDIQVRHLRWIEEGAIAIHLVEEQIGGTGNGQKPPALYCTNVYRQGPSGWRMILHQNAPTPPPAGAVPPGRPAS